MKKIKTIQYEPSDRVRTVLQLLRLRGESEQACIDRLLGNLLEIASSYEEQFGTQKREPVKHAWPAGERSGT